MESKVAEMSFNSATFNVHNVFVHACVRIAFLLHELLNISSVLYHRYVQRSLFEGAHNVDPDQVQAPKNCSFEKPLSYN